MKRAEELASCSVTQCQSAKVGLEYYPKALVGVDKGVIVK